jgi:hypothetical protein
VGTRFEVVTHKGAKILIANYSLANREEVWALTHAIIAWLEKQEPNSANILFDMNKPFYEATHVNHWKKSLGRNDAIIRKSCFINASPLMFVLLQTMRAFANLTGAPMKKDRGIFFENREEAMDWLAK